MKVLKTSDFNDYVQNGITVVDFFATWCGPCKMLTPVFEEASAEMTDVKFAKVDIDESLELAQKYSITTVPTILIFKDGEKVDSLVGFMPKNTLVQNVQKHV
ncbi:MAG: thioredoxin [Peptostreptococcaceae bacterium]